MAAKTTRAATRADEFAQRIKDGALRPSGVLLQAPRRPRESDRRHAVSVVALPPPVVDLLVRLRLAPNNHLRGVDISRQLLIDPSRASRLIDRAEAAGVVARLADPNDRRAQRITFTKEGRAAIEKFLPVLMAVLDRTVFEALSSKEFETLTRLLTKLERAARTVAESADLEGRAGPSRG